MAPKDTALALAQQALHKIETHEAVCAERHKQIAAYISEAKDARAKQHLENQQSMAAVKSSVTRLYDWRFKAAVALLVMMNSGMASMAAYIIVGGR